MRARALGMQTSDDLPAVSAAVFREIQSLYPTAQNSVLGVVELDEDWTRQWTVLPENWPGDFSAVGEVYEGVRVIPEIFVLSKLVRVHPEFERALRAGDAEKHPVHVSKRLDFERAIKAMVQEGLWTPEQGRKAEQWDPPGDLTMSFVQYRRTYLFSLLLEPTGSRATLTSCVSTSARRT